MLTLVIGDQGIPLRSVGMPQPLKRLLTPGKIDQVLCTGNGIDTETYEFLASLSPEFLRVASDLDCDTQLPMSRIVKQGSMTIGLVSSSAIVPSGDRSVLALIARQMGVDVLAYGGPRFECFKAEGRFFVCPGSATGAIDLLKDIENVQKISQENGVLESNNNNNTVSSPQESDIYKNFNTQPYFVLMDAQGAVLMLYVYTLSKEDNQLCIEKLQYRKGD